MSNPTVIEIVRVHLEQNGYDGLFNEDAGCACENGDLAPCMEIGADCEAGYKTECDCGEHDWHIQRRKHESP